MVLCELEEIRVSIMNEIESNESDSIGSISKLYQLWRAGRTEAFGELIDRFWPRLMALANSTLGGRSRRISDADDVLQNAMINFWRKVDRGDLQENLDRNDLWNILGSITVRKALTLQERENAQKRGGGWVMTAMSLENLEAKASYAEFDLLCTELLAMLDPGLRSVALLRLMGYKNREIAQELECTERTVERKLQLVRSIWDDEAANWDN